MIFKLSYRCARPSADWRHLPVGGQRREGECESELLAHGELSGESCPPGPRGNSPASLLQFPAVHIRPTGGDSREGAAHAPPSAAAGAGDLGTPGRPLSGQPGPTRPARPGAEQLDATFPDHVAASWVSTPRAPTHSPGLRYVRNESCGVIFLVPFSISVVLVSYCWCQNYPRRNGSQHADRLSSSSVAQKCKTGPWLGLRQAGSPEPRGVCALAVPSLGDCPPPGLFLLLPATSS